MLALEVVFPLPADGGSGEDGDHDEEDEEGEGGREHGQAEQVTIGQRTLFCGGVTVPFAFVVVFEVFQGDCEVEKWAFLGDLRFDL